MLYLLFSISIFHHIIKPVKKKKFSFISFLSPFLWQAMMDQCPLGPVLWQRTASPLVVVGFLHTSFPFLSGETSISQVPKPPYLSHCCSHQSQMACPPEKKSNKVYILYSNDHLFYMNYNNLSQNLNTWTSMSFLTIIEINPFYLSFTIFQ